ncbi:MAG: phosphopantothenoylcysteine decarboxylase [Patescibacteria group bacterium]
MTAGPVWVPIDKVRVITNVFAGNLGFEIAKIASRRGHKVTLMLGPGRVCDHKLRSIKVRLIKFHYYDELFRIFIKEIKENKYDAIFHSAAISDYQLSKKYSGKIKSGKKTIFLKLKPTKKIVNYIKKITPSTILVKFKLEVNKTSKQLIQIASKSMAESRADFMVANEYKRVRGVHEAFILDHANNIIFIKGKRQIAKKIVNLVEKQNTIQ